MPIVLCELESIANLSFVPTPSVADTSSGSVKPAAFGSNIPPKPPIPLATPLRLVAFASGRIISISAFPAAMLTPESLYVSEIFLLHWPCI